MKSIYRFVGLLTFISVTGSILWIYQGRKITPINIINKDEATGTPTKIVYREEVVVVQTTIDKHILVEASVTREDNLLDHKSCLRTDNHAGHDCRNCAFNKNGNSKSINNYTSRNECPLIQPHGWCPPFTSSPWDNPPRQEAYHDPTKRGHSHLIRHWDLPYAYELIPCETSDECWDYSRCGEAGSNVTVFAYGPSNSSASILVDKAVTAFPNKLERVQDPQLACLLVVTKDSFDSDDINVLLSHPAYGDGSNHFIWRPNYAMFLQHTDRPFNFRGNYGKASLGMATYMHSQVRPGYDVPLGLPKHVYSKEISANKPATLPSSGERKILLLFKGNIFSWSQVWWQHRYIAVEYWEQSDDVVVDVTCQGKNEYKIPADKYASLLASSVFTFCPGGGSTNSYRFVEVLGMGSIPIVVSDFVPPFWPEYDWSGCLLEVTEARIIDLPRRVRAISTTEIQQRQARCAELFELTIGWAYDNQGRLVNSDETSFVTARHVWIRRIHRRKAQRLERVQAELERKSVMASQSAGIKLSGKARFV